MAETKRPDTSGGEITPSHTTEGHKVEKAMRRRDFLRKGRDLIAPLATAAVLAVSQDVHAGVESTLQDTLPPMIEVSGDELLVTLSSARVHSDFISAIHARKKCTPMEGKTMTIVTMSETVPPITQADADKLGELGIHVLKIRDNARGKGEDLQLTSTIDKLKKGALIGGAGLGGATILGAGVYYLWRRRNQVRTAGDEDDDEGGGKRPGRRRRFLDWADDTLRSARDKMNVKLVEVERREAESHQDAYRQGAERHTAIKSMREQGLLNNAHPSRRELARKLARFRPLYAEPLGQLMLRMQKDRSGVVREILEGDHDTTHDSVQVAPQDIFEIRRQCAILRRLNTQVDAIMEEARALAATEDAHEAEAGRAGVDKALAGGLLQALWADPENREDLRALIRTVANMGITLTDCFSFLEPISNLAAVAKVAKKFGKDSKPVTPEEAAELEAENLRLETLLEDLDVNAKNATEPKVKAQFLALCEQTRSKLKELKKVKKEMEKHKNDLFTSMDLTPNVGSGLVASMEGLDALLSAPLAMIGFPFSIPSYAIPTILQFRHDKEKVWQAMRIIAEIMRNRKMDSKAERSAIERALAKLFLK